jgi:hypothetical protein
VPGGLPSEQISPPHIGVYPLHVPLFELAGQVARVVAGIAVAQEMTTCAPAAVSARVRPPDVVLITGDYRSLLDQLNASGARVMYLHAPSTSPCEDTS